MRTGLKLIMAIVLVATSVAFSGCGKGTSGNSSASLDREREALYAVIPKSQVESIVFGTGSQDEKSNAYLNVNRLGLMDKILDLQRRGAFGKEAADAINEK